MKLEELLRTFIGIGSWIYRINLYETDSKGNTKYITDHHMIDYYIDMNNFKDLIQFFEVFLFMSCLYLLFQN